MQRAAPDVDVLAVGRGRRSGAPSAPSRRSSARRELRRRAVRAVDHDASCRRASPRPRPPGARGSARARSPLSLTAAELGAPARPARPARASISSSRSSDSFVPSRAKNLMPLSSGGLCEAEITTPDDALELRREERDRRRGLDPGQDHVAARRADAVRERVLQPLARAPACRAPPGTSGGRRRAVPSTTTAARPRPKARSRVSSVPATPRTPSVPKSRPTAARLPEAAFVPRNRRDVWEHRT